MWHPRDKKCTHSLTTALHKKSPAIDRKARERLRSQQSRLWCARLPCSAPWNTALQVTASTDSWQPRPPSTLPPPHGPPPWPPPLHALQTTSRARLDIGNEHTSTARASPAPPASRAPLYQYRGRSSWSVACATPLLAVGAGQPSCRSSSARARPCTA